MNTDEIIYKLTQAGFGPNICEAFATYMETTNILPEFHFALRDDVKDTGELFLPKKAEPSATGYDVRACQEDRKDIVLRSGQYFKIPLGFRCFCPAGWYYQLHPRSSSFVKKHMHNLIGIIDESYPLQTILAGQYIPDISSLGTDIVIKFGDPVGQIIPIRREDMNTNIITNKEFDDLCEKRKAIRTGGFGSTG